MDFAKAFNRQDHTILVTKHCDMGVPAWLLLLTTATYWYSTDGGYVAAEDMGTARGMHGCTVDTTGLIYVAGGYNGNSNYLNSVEIFSPSSDQWQYGPDIPVATAGGVMLTVKKDVVYIGGYYNKKIWTLVKTDGEPTGWREVGEMKQERFWFSAIKLTMAGCEHWKL